jgi:hypothetical protein
LLAAFAPVAKAQDLFTFDSETITPPNFLQSGSTLVSDNDPTQSALVSITNTVDPAFSVVSAYEFESNGTGNNSYGTNLHDIVLTNADSLPHTELTLTFAHPIDALTLQFAIISPFNFSQGTANVVTDLTLSGGATSETNGGTYNTASGNFQGSLETSGGTFSTVTLKFGGLGIADFGYAIDSLQVTPEPGVLPLALASIIPAAGFLRRRRAR